MGLFPSRQVRVYVKLDGVAPFVSSIRAKLRVFRVVITEHVLHLPILKQPVSVT